MRISQDFSKLPDEGKNIQLDIDIYVVNQNLSLSQYTLKEFIDENKEYVPTPHGVQAQYFVEDNELRQWMFGSSFLIHEYDSPAEAQLALKVFDLDSVHRESAPLFFYIKADAEKAIAEMLFEDAYMA